MNRLERPRSHRQIDVCALYLEREREKSDERRGHKKLRRRDPAADMMQRMKASARREESMKPKVYWRLGRSFSRIGFHYRGESKG